jgi:hypothetical protein
MDKFLQALQVLGLALSSYANKHSLDWYKEVVQYSIL